MTEQELTVPPDIELEVVALLIEEAAGKLGLTVRTRGALGKFRGSTHWHYCRMGIIGTLEITLWPMQRRCWISVHIGRTADWVPQTVETLSLSLNETFLKAADSN